MCHFWAEDLRSSSLVGHNPLLATSVKIKFHVEVKPGPMSNHNEQTSQSDDPDVVLMSLAVSQKFKHRVKTYDPTIPLIVPKKIK